MTTTTEELLAAARKFREAKAKAEEVVDQLEAAGKKEDAGERSPDLFPFILGSISSIAELSRARNALLEAALKEPTA